VREHGIGIENLPLIDELGDTDVAAGRRIDVAEE